MKLEWTKSSGKEDIYAIYIDRGGAKYPLATIEFAPALGRDDVERLFRAAPELLEACKAALSELEHAHSVTNDAFNECDGAIQAMLINALPEREDSVIPKLTTAIAKAEPPQ